MNFIRAYLSALLLVFTFSISAQETSPIRFDLEKQRINDGEVVLTIKAYLEPGIKLYSIEKASVDVPYSTISFDMCF